MLIWKTADDPEVEFNENERVRLVFVEYRKKIHAVERPATD